MLTSIKTEAAEILWAHQETDRILVTGSIPKAEGQTTQTKATHKLDEQHCQMDGRDDADGVLM